MKQFMDKDFLLETPTAVKLFEQYAKDEPIFDYHCHLSAKEIYEDVAFEDIAQVWLGGDHYKWRLMRANGNAEELVTGNAGGWEKFQAFAQAMPYAMGNPLYHWSHLELRRYFGIEETLSAATAETIWNKANAAIKAGGFTPRALIGRSNVYALCTTEDPADSLEYHALLAKDDSFQTKVLPAFRPDVALAVEAPGYADYINRLAAVAGQPIESYAALEQALLKRMDAFDACGCVASDHGFTYMPFVKATAQDAQTIFAAALAGKPLTAAQADQFKTVLMLFLGREYHRRGWAMELHMGAARSQNTRMVAKVGINTGYDSIADHQEAENLAALLNELEKTEQLPKSVLFTLNPTDDFVLGAMTGNFQGSEIPGKMQFGTAWWFQDHRDGMERQMRVLANTGLLGRFIGMLTDSRSFLSYPRHEYFRRILCNLVGGWIENGEYPADLAQAGAIVKGICFKNAKAYMGI